MLVEDLFRSLSYGRLSDLSIGMEGAGSIEEKSQDRVISYAQKVLKKLHIEFSHKSHYVTLATVPDRSVYKLVVEDPAVEFQSAPYQSAMNQTPPIMKIVEVRRKDDLTTVEDESAVIGLGRRDDGLRQTVTFPSHDTLRFSDPQNAIYEIEYRAAEQKLSRPAQLTEEIFIHPGFAELLELGIASRVYKDMNTETSLAKGQMLEGEYNALLATIKNEDISHESDVSEFSKFHMNGWV